MDSVSTTNVFPSPNPYQDVIAQHLINQGAVLCGGYVYKTLVNGDASDDSDISCSYNVSTNELSKNLITDFCCKWDSKRRYLICPCPKQVLGQDVKIDVHPPGYCLGPSRLPLLEYRLIDGKGVIVHSYYDYMARHQERIETARIIRQLRNRKYWSWSSMRKKDRQYFSAPLWIDTNKTVRMEEIMKKHALMLQIYE
jgi:hypothetical protein